MRVLLVVVGVCLALGCAMAQTPSSKLDAPNTKLEAFLATKGALIVVETADLGTISVAREEREDKLYFFTLTAHKPGADTPRVRGMEIWLYDGDLGRFGSTVKMYLDADELPALSAALETMLKDKETKDVLLFGTQDGLAVFCQPAAGRWWVSYGEVETNIASGNALNIPAIYPPLAELATMKAAIDKAIASFTPPAK